MPTVALNRKQFNMYRLPDTYYTKQTLDGNIAYTSPFQEQPTVYQGDDIELSVYLSVEGQPVKLSEYTIEAVVKKSPIAENELWTGNDKDGGINEVGKDSGYFSIFIPRYYSAYFVPGMYHLAVVLTDKFSTNKENELRFNILNTSFNVELSPSSPNPRQQSGDVTSVEYDSVNMEYTITTTTTEPTLPHIVKYN